MKKIATLITVTLVAGQLFAQSGKKMAPPPPPVHPGTMQLAPPPPPPPPLPPPKPARGHKEKAKTNAPTILKNKEI